MYPGYLLLGTASLLLSYLTYVKSYSYWTTAEHLVLALLLFLGFGVSYSLVQTIKFYISFFLFILDIQYLKINKNQWLPKLRYLLGSWKYWKNDKLSCHAWYAIDDKIFHADYDKCDADCNNRLFDLTSKEEVKKTISNILQYRFIAPCV